MNISKRFDAFLTTGRTNLRTVNHVRERYSGQAGTVLVVSRHQTWDLPWSAFVGHCPDSWGYVPVAGPCATDVLALDGSMLASDVEPGTLPAVLVALAGRRQALQVSR